MLGDLAMPCFLCLLLLACAAAAPNLVQEGRSLSEAVDYRSTGHQRFRGLRGDFHDPMPAIAHPVCLFQEAYEPDSCFFNSYHLPNVVPFTSVETMTGRLYWQWTKLGHICEGSQHQMACEAHKSKACIWTSNGCGVKYSVEQYFVLTMGDRESWGYRSARCNVDGTKAATCKAMENCTWTETNYGGLCSLTYDKMRNEQLRTTVQRVVEQGTAKIEEYALTYNGGKVDDRARMMFQVQACFHALDKHTCLGLTYKLNKQKQNLCEWVPFPEQDAKQPPGGSCMFGKEGYLQAFFGHDPAISLEWHLWNKKCGEFSDDDKSTECFLAFSKEKDKKPE